jgi:cytochrome c biogenesis protein CcmG, thiol:disulfide interchange protein DsbE
VRPPAILLFAAVALWGCPKPQARRSDGPTSTELAQLRAQRLGGGTYALAEDVGRVVFLDVWATWCEPCKDALPAYSALAAELAGTDARFYALSVDEDIRQVARFVQETGLTLPVLLDEGAHIAERLLSVRALPTTFLIDRRGRIRYVHEEYRVEHLAQIRAELQLLLAEP